MDLAKTLIRSTVRGFYDRKHVLVIDALMIHSALPVEDLAFVLGMQVKDLRKLCGKLREDHMMSTHSRQEYREGQQRPINREYYYINFHDTIDAIKYKVLLLTKKVKDMYKSTEERKDYKCQRCKASWTEMEVLDNVGPEGFLCHRCGAPLERDDEAAGDSGGHEKQSRLMGQLEKVLISLRQIDAEDIPKNDFESALAVSKPAKRDETVNPIKSSAPSGGARGPPVTVKGIAQAAAPLEINLTTNSEKTAEEQAAEAKRKAAITAQNILPDWISTSTVTGQTTAAGVAERDRMANNTLLDTAKVEDDEKKESLVLNNELDAYYAQIEAEKQEQAREDRDDSSDDEEDDEFEDVGLDTSHVNTPPSVISETTNHVKNGLPNGILKPQASESGNSNSATGTSTPKRSQSVGADDEDRPPKKVKLEVQSNGVIEDEPTPGDKISDEDDEAEFEDAL